MGLRGRPFAPLYGALDFQVQRLVQLLGRSLSRWEVYGAVLSRHGLSGWLVSNFGVVVTVVMEHTGWGLCGSFGLIRI